MYSYLGICGCAGTCARIREGKPHNRLKEKGLGRDRLENGRRYYCTAYILTIASVSYLIMRVRIGKFLFVQNEICISLLWFI